MSADRVTLRLETGEVLAEGISRDPWENIEDEERARDPEAYDRKVKQWRRLKERGITFNIA